MTLAIDWVAEQVAADFTARLITGVEVVYGAEKRSHVKPGPRVVFGLEEEFTIGPPAGLAAPGVVLLEGTSPPKGARSVATHQQPFVAQIDTPPPEGTSRATDRSKQAATLCAALLHETIVSLYRVAHGSISFDRGRWLGADEADFRYPSRVLLYCTLHIPVLDVRWPQVTITDLITKLYAVDPGDGTETLDAETPAP
jgi:hypothetical protein